MRGEDTVRTEYTNGQLYLAKILEEIGFIVDMEVPVFPYKADILLRKEWVVIEYDGAHSFKKRDKKRDEYLIEHYKLPTLRITQLSPKQELIKKIADWISTWEESAKERREWAFENS